MKRLSWFSVVGTVCVFLVMFFFPKLVISQYGQETNDIYLLLGAFGVAIFAFILFCSDRCRHNVPGLRNKILSTLGAVAGLIIIVTAWALLLAGAVIAPALQDSERLANLIAAYLFSVVYLIFCVAKIWYRYEVEQGKLVVVNGCVYYPRQRYRLWPWLNDKAEIIDTTFDIAVVKLLLQCQDGPVEVDVSVRVRLDTLIALESGITAFNKKEFVSAAQYEMANFLAQQAHGWSIESVVRRWPKIRRAFWNNLERRAAFPVAEVGDLTMILKT